METNDITCVNSLLFLSLRTLISIKLFKCSNSIAIKKCINFDKNDNTEYKKNILLEYDLVKLCQEFEDCGIWSNSGIETDKIIVFYDMIQNIMKIIRNCRGKIFGGFVRDWIIRKDFNFKDIDINFNEEWGRDNFISRLSDDYLLHIIENVQSDTNNVTNIEHDDKYKLCYHLKKNKPIPKTYGTNNIVKIEVQHKKFPSLIIKMDLIRGFNFCNTWDFDINHLIYKNDTIICGYKNKDKNDKNTIIENIKEKKFVLLSKCGKIDSKHCQLISQKKFALINKTIELDSCDHNDCLCRYSPVGIKIKERIIKMQKRGWKLQNEICKNNMCVLSDDKLFDSYVIAKTNELNKLHYLTINKMVRDVELKELTKKYKFDLSAKEINTLYNDKKIEKRKKDIIKNNNKPFNKKLLNYRKFDINKKNIFIEYENNSFEEEIEEELSDDNSFYDEIEKEQTDDKSFNFNVNTINKIKRDAELKELTKKYKFDLSEKEIKILHNEKKVEKRKKDILKNTNKFHKIQLLNYRKSNINKKNVFIEYDNNSFEEEIDEEQ